MKFFTGLRKTVEKREWTKVEITISHVKQLRSVIEYIEWFDNKDSKGRYAVYSIPDAFEYWFEEPETATEFVLRFA